MQARPSAKPGDIINALSKAKQISDMGYGRIDLYLALTNLFPGNGKRRQINSVILAPGFHANY